MTEDSLISNSDRVKAIKWLREVLTAILEISPLSYWQKKKANRFLNRMPDWLIGSWAEALNIDYISGFAMYPYMAKEVSSDTGRYLAQQYLESRDVVPTANTLDDLVRVVVRQANERSLPIESDILERQVCALALAGCTAEGTNFSESTRDILSDAENHTHPLIEYRIALEHRDTSKIEALDATLTGGRYGSWVAERLTEMKRYLGLEPPHFTVRTGERTPQWDLLWQKNIYRR